jgi:hypothetical protein
MAENPSTTNPHKCTWPDCGHDPLVLPCLPVNDSGVAQYLIRALRDAYDLAVRQDNYGPMDRSKAELQRRIQEIRDLCREAITKAEGR